MRRLPFVLVAFVALALPGAALAADDPYAELQWGLERIDGRAAWHRATGEGVTVAVIDSGVDPSHPDLAGRLVAGYDFVDGDRDPADRNGHGTLIAGIIAANASNGVGIAGIAPRAKIMPIRVLDEHGTGASSDVARGIAWAIDRGADVINLSLAQDAGRGLLGNLLADPAVDDAIHAAAEAGATVVIAAGNDPRGGRDRTAYDASVPGAVVVGATTAADRRAAYANHGDGLDLVAPGGGSARNPRDAACTERNGIVSTWWNPDTGRSSYGAGCGTSMAVAFVSGVAAMLHERGATNAEAVAAMISSADDIAPPGRDAASAAGRLNAAAAVGVPANDDERASVLGRRVQGPLATAGAADVARGTEPRPRPRTIAPMPKTSSTEFPRPAAVPPLATGTLPVASSEERVPLSSLAAMLLALVSAAHVQRAIGVARRVSRD